jgi:hypothetical protein
MEKVQKPSNSVRDIIVVNFRIQCVVVRAFKFLVRLVGDVTNFVIKTVSLVQTVTSAFQGAVKLRIYHPGRKE